MTIEEMVDAVQLGLQKIDSFARDDFTPDEIVHYLNQAQLEFIKDRFQGQNESGFEETPKRTADLQEIVATEPLIPVLEATSVILGSQYEVLLPYPDPYMFFVYLELGLTRTANPVIASKTYVPCKPGVHGREQFYRVVAGQHSPYIRNPIVLFREGFMHIFTDVDTTVEDGRLTFVRQPDDLLLDQVDPTSSISSELAVHTHFDIVNIAIRIMMDDLADNTQSRSQLEMEQS